MAWIVGLDVGSKTIGMARADTRSWMVQPLRTLSRRGVQKDIDAVLRVLVEESIERFIVGLPLGESGEEQRSSRLARQFARALGESSNIPVLFQDESHSTLEAEHRLREAGVRESGWAEVIDSWAAAVILEDWLATSMARGD